MSQHPMNTPHTPRKRLPFALPLAFTTALGIGIATRYAPANDAGREPFAEPETPTAAETPKVALSDVTLARTALTAIDADPELRGVNVVVSIVDRVAVIGGPVAGQRQSKRVEEIVRAVPGIVEVRNTCFVSVGPDPMLSAVAEKMVSSLPPRPVMYDLPGVLTGTIAPSAPNTSSLMASADPPSTVVVRKPTAESGVLGGPVSPATPTAPVTVHPGTPTPGTLTVNRADVLAMADNVRKTDTRFGRLAVEIRGEMLVISGSAPLTADAWDYAEKLRGVPGVSRVVVGAVTGK